MRILACACFVLLTAPAFSQHYRFHQYRVEQGLPSDVIKAVTQDSLGFFWIATDDGLVKYDGVRFTPYKNAFRSQYVKGFLHTHDGRLLAFGDLDIIEIRNQIDTVFFSQVLRGQRFFSDSTLWFPKAMYEDRQGRIWIAEPKTVLRYEGEGLHRYDLGDPNRSTVFTRSFSFFETDAGDLFAVAYNGTVFRYDAMADAFREQRDLRLPADVSQVLYHRGQLLVAAREGLFSAKVIDGLVQDPVNLFPIRHVSNLLLSPGPDSTILVSTYQEDLYKVRFTPEFEWENLAFNFNGVNSTYVSRDGDIWVATDRGVVLVQDNLFMLADINSEAHFVEGIAEDREGDLFYYCSKETLVELRRAYDGEWERTVIDQSPDNYYQALQFHNGRLWAASNTRVKVFEKGRHVRSWDFAGEGNFVHDVFIDSKGSAWLSQGGSTSVKSIAPDGSVSRVPLAGLQQGEIFLVREGRDGLYAAGGGTRSYLFFKRHGDDTFRNVSLPIAFEMSGDLSITDLAVDGDLVWLASSEGLLRYDHNSISRIDFGEGFERYPVSSVEILDENNILFSNSFGVLRYNPRTNEYWLYDENTGLPSNTVTDHGIFVSSRKEVWVGTSYGVAVATGSLLENKVTRPPFCVQARVNGKAIRFVDGVRAPYGAYISLVFSPVSFPENKIQLQWRITGEHLWKPVDGQQLDVSNLEEGLYVVEVRAKKNTGMGWSQPSRLAISIDYPYWKKSEFLMIVFLMVAVVAWGSFAFSSAITSQRRQHLQEQVQERTQELQKANEELRQRNAELDRFVYSASHDLSAPLKSILGLIAVAKMDKPGEGQAQYLAMMERSVLKLEEFIQEVVTYSRNARMPVRYEAFSFQELVASILEDHEYSPNYRHIQFSVEDQLTGYLHSDKMRIKIILNNLISNAIKFHWLDGGRQPFVRVVGRRVNEHYEISVADNGRGIPESHLPRIFEMFYRATEQSQGSGLGLYILKESVTKLGGTVEADSRLEEGTTFRILLPVPFEEIRPRARNQG